MTNLQSPRRSLLFIPGDNDRKLEKGAQLPADTAVFDLEDAVPFKQKEVARRQVVTALTTLEYGRTECLVRVNPPDSDQFAADIEAVAAAKPAGIVIPKISAAAHVQAVAQQLTAVEQATDQPPGTIRLFALIETAQAVMNIKEIAQASSRLVGLMLGAEDLAVDLGARRSTAGWEVFYARSALVAAAAAYGLQAFDMVFVDVQDLAALQTEAAFARQLGYTGKMTIHPHQLAVINEAFSPTETEINKARQLVDAYQTHLAGGTGAFTLDGRMVDKPIIRAAEQLLERARLCQLIAE